MSDTAVIASGSPLMTKPPIGKGHPEEVVERIIALAKAGHTRSVIAARVGGLSRSAICGILARRGIRSTAAPKVKAFKATAARASKTRKPADRNGAPATNLKLSKLLNLNPETPAEPVTFEDLQSHHCRWPTGDRMYCGEAKAMQSYCRHHYAVAYGKVA